MYGRMMLKMCEEKQIKMRKCNRCEEEKPLTEEYFYKEKSSKDGLATICKVCVKGKYKQTDNFNINEWYGKKSNTFKNKWAFEDIQWIYNNYLNINKQELIKKFPKSNYKTLTNIIYQWDIKKIEKNDNWSDEDIEFLENNYPNMPQKDIEKQFPNRTWDGIKNKASKIGVCRDDETLFKINSESHKGQIVSEEARKKMSKTRRGSNNVNWKGGLTPLVTYFRSILYEWKFDSLKAYDFKCAFTKTNNKDLEIHHVNENFSDMIYKTFEILNLPIYDNMIKYTDDELKSINQVFLDLHYKSGLGIPLKKIIHKVFHIVYGLNNNTKEQFDEFTKRYWDGEFDEIMKITDEKIRNKKRKKRKYKRLNKEEVLKAKELLNKGFPISYVSKEFGVKEAAIYSIKTGKSWKGILKENS